MDELPLEVVERKGRGHPDTICDLLAERISCDLGHYYLKTCGRILHYNVDKALEILGIPREKFIAVLARDDCLLSPVGKGKKYDVVKLLSALFARPTFGRRWNFGNTLIVDDTFKKLRLNPEKNYIVVKPSELDYTVLCARIQMQFEELSKPGYAQSCKPFTLGQIMLHGHPMAGQIQAESNNKPANPAKNQTNPVGSPKAQDASNQGPQKKFKKRPQYQQAPYAQPYYPPPSAFQPPNFHQQSHHQQPRYQQSQAPQPYYQSPQQYYQAPQQQYYQQPHYQQSQAPQQQYYQPRGQDDTRQKVPRADPSTFNLFYRDHRNLLQNTMPGADEKALRFQAGKMWQSETESTRADYFNRANGGRK